MSLLEDSLSEQKDLMNRGYSEQQIQCAALMLIAKHLKPQIFLSDQSGEREPIDGDD